MTSAARFRGRLRHRARVTWCLSASRVPPDSPGQRAALRPRPHPESDAASSTRVSRPSGRTRIAVRQAPGVANQPPQSGSRRFHPRHAGPRVGAQPVVPRVPEPQRTVVGCGRPSVATIAPDGMRRPSRRFPAEATSPERCPAGRPAPVLAKRRRSSPNRLASLPAPAARPAPASAPTLAVSAPPRRSSGWIDASAPGHPSADPVDRPPRRGLLLARRNLCPDGWRADLRGLHQPTPVQRKHRDSADGQQPLTARRGHSRRSYQPGHNTGGCDPSAPRPVFRHPDHR